MRYIMALDQGTTSSRAIIFNKSGEIVGVAQKEFEQIYPKAGWVEHRPKDILETQIEVMRKVLLESGITAEQIQAIGITNQRETTLMWDKNSGEAVYNAIVWQCRRTSSLCDSLKDTPTENLIYSKTGLMVDAYFSATKIKWILDNIKGVRERAENGDLLFGTVDTYLMWQLSGGKIHSTDYTNASRTMIYNIHSLEWDKQLLELFNIPEKILPEVCPSSHCYGYLDKSILGVEIPICGCVGDQQGALFGQLCTQKGSVKNTYGTGCFMLMNVGKKAIESKRGLITTLAASGEDRPDYVLEGSVFVGGAVIQWLRDELKMISSAKETEEIAKSVNDCNGVYIVPAFVGLGAPHWDANARGIICGLTRGAKKEHIVRAALEAIAYQVFDVLHAMQIDTDTEILSLNVDGGASANNFLMQFQSDIINSEVVRPKVIETTALGACYLAGLAVGYWKDIDDIKCNISIDAKFNPKMDNDTRMKLLLGWQEAIARAKYS